MNRRKRILLNIIAGVMLAVALYLTFFAKDDYSKGHRSVNDYSDSTQ